MFLRGHSNKDTLLKRFCGGFVSVNYRQCKGFAESGLHDEALHIMGKVAGNNRGFNSVIAEELGLRGVRLMYGTVTI